MSLGRRSLLSSPLPRRDWMKLLGGALLGSQMLAAQGRGATGQDRKAQARANLPLGVAGAIYGGLPAEEAARRMQEEGFATVLANFAYADATFDPRKPDWAVAEKILDCFRRHGLRVATLFGYYNVVDPDVERRKQGEARIEFLIANWERLGCPIVATETGTFNTQSEWLDAPENQTEAAFVQCRDALGRLAHLAEKSGAIVAIETYWRNVIGTIDRTERLFREVNSSALKLVMDPCNYFRNEDLPRMDAMLTEMFQRLGDRIVVAHAKDVREAPNGPEHPASGKGSLNYPLYLRLLAQLDRPLDLMLEHSSLEDLPRARQYVVEQFDKI